MSKVQIVAAVIAYLLAAVQTVIMIKRAEQRRRNGITTHMMTESEVWRIAIVWPLWVMAGVIAAIVDAVVGFTDKMSER